MKLTWPVLSLAALIAVLACAAPPPPSPQPTSPSSPNPAQPLDVRQLTGSVVFVSAIGDTQDLWILRFDGSARPRPEQLTHAAAGASFHRPTWSPDGSHIAYQQREGETVAVYVMAADGSNQRLIAEDAAAPAWSPLGDELALSNLRTGERGIAVASLSRSTTVVEVLTTVPDAVPEEYPTWSPDGARLAFTSHRGGGSDIWTVARDGSDLGRLVEHRALDNSPDWAPDGSRVAFTSDRSGEGDVYVVNGDGSELVRLTSGPYFEGGQVWSPDGMHIVYSARDVPISQEGDLGLWVMRADGSGGTLLYDGAGEDLMADWAP